MKRFVLKNLGAYHHPAFSSDIERIAKICADRGFEIEKSLIITTWEQYSDQMYCAGWIGLPGDDDVIFAIIKERCDIEKAND